MPGSRHWNESSPGSNVREVNLVHSAAMCHRNFRTEGSETLIETARKQAMADAKKKAELLANQAGLTLGTAISIRDEVNPYPFSPAQSAGVVAAAPSLSVPVSVGEQELAASVQVVYELRTPR